MKKISEKSLKDVKILGEVNLMNLLEKARADIDKIDQEMAALYEKRLEAVEDVLRYKLENSMDVLDSSREKLILERNVNYIKNPKYKDLYLNFQKYVMAASREYQQSLMAKEVVAYSGIEGAFAHMACKKIFPHNPLLQFNNFEDVFQAVTNRKAQFGVIPFENTNSGLVGEVLDALLEYPVYIQSVFDLKIEQCLLGIKGASLKDIEWVYSKDQALAQARIFLKGLQAKPVPYPNTALAAQFVAKEQDKTKAAIAAKENAALYDLEVLASNIEENNTNETRFLVIGLQPNPIGERFSLIISVLNEPGALGKVVEIVSRHGLNMCSIQSRPRKGKPFEYFFYIELEQTQKKEQLEACIAELENNCEQIKILGAYPMERDSEQ